MTDLKCLKRQRGTLSEVSEQVIQVRTDEIRPNRAQPRANFDQNSIIRLADSIRRYGILQPLTVREADPDDSCKYELIAGERRLRAAKMLGYLTVPCIVKAADEQISAELAIIENLLREDLNMFEEAYGYRKLIENHRLTQEEVAKRMSVSQSAVANKLRLLKLTYEEQKIILESGLTERHARALLRIESSAERLKTLDHIIEHKLNVNATEMYIESEIEKQRKAKRDVSSGEVSDVDASKKAFVSAESAIPKRKEKELSEAVQAIRRRVDTWTANGGSADINIANRPTTVEIVIRLHK